MAIKHLGKAKPNDPFFTRGYTINIVPNPPAPKKPETKKPAKPPKNQGK
jgi:hypothetical protein